MIDWFAIDRDSTQSGKNILVTQYLMMWTGCQGNEVAISTIWKYIKWKRNFFLNDCEMLRHNDSEGRLAPADLAFRRNRSRELLFSSYLLFFRAYYAQRNCFYSNVYKWNWVMQLCTFFILQYFQIYLFWPFFIADLHY